MRKRSSKDARQTSQSEQARMFASSAVSSAWRTLLQRNHQQMSHGEHQLQRIHQREAKVDAESHQDQAHKQEQVVETSADHQEAHHHVVEDQTQETAASHKEDQETKFLITIDDFIYTNDHK